MSRKKTIMNKKEELLNTIDKLNYTLEPFYRINYNQINDLKFLIHKLENEISIMFNEELKISNNQIKDSIKDLKKNEIIGVLPKLLLSKEIFSSNKELILFSNKVLDTGIDLKSKRPRQHLVGTIIDDFLEKKYDRDLNIINKIYDYIYDRAKSVLTSEDFFKEWDKIIGNIKNDQYDQNR
ncbi:MAG: hypothetical protein JRJ62_11610 [Deltaproteobacteria bacterium]|nr:hypothetical protein [Deltaproteobacteria bacterium]